jgi:hypothetical protein
MKLNGTMTVVVIGGAFAAWLAADAMSGTRDTASRSAERAVPVDARGEALAGEVARLHERLAPNATPLQPGRNLFQFTAPKPRRDMVPVRPALTEAAPIAPAAAPPPPFKLIGIAEDAGADGPIRTAIVSAPGQLFMVKEGQNVTLRYKVTRIAADVVELQDLGDHSTLRLALK